MSLVLGLRIVVVSWVLLFIKSNALFQELVVMESLRRPVGLCNSLLVGVLLVFFCGIGFCIGSSAVSNEVSALFLWSFFSIYMTLLHCNCFHLLALWLQLIFH